MNWGKGIVVAFVCFIGVIATLVTISMKQDVSLVAKDYYVQEIAYQDQIDRIENKNRMEIQPSVELKTGNIELLIKKLELEGTIHFFRPSNAKLDKKYVIKLDKNGKQLFSASDFEKGLWKVKINFTSEGREYYSEHSLVL